MSTCSSAFGWDDSSAARSLIITHSPWQLMWLGLCCVALAIALASEAAGFKILGGLLLAYAAQGLIAEWLGVRVTPDAVTGPQALRQRALLHAVAKADIAGPDPGHYLQVEIARTGPRRAAHVAKRQNFDAVSKPRDKTGVFFGGQGVRAQNQHLQKIIGGPRRSPLNQSFPGSCRRRNGKAGQNAAPRSAFKSPSARSQARAAVRMTPTAIPRVEPPVLARASNRLGERPGIKFCKISNSPAGGRQANPRDQTLAPAKIAQREKEPGPAIGDEMFERALARRCAVARRREQARGRRSPRRRRRPRHAQFFARETRDDHGESRWRRRRSKIGATASRSPGVHRFATSAAH